MLGIDYYWWVIVKRDQLPPDIDLYEFGVSNPYTVHSSTTMLLDYCRKAQIPFSSYNGFDSFEGLPPLGEHDDTEKCIELGWDAGSFSALKFFSGKDSTIETLSGVEVPELHSVSEIADHITGEYSKLVSDNQNVNIVPGYISDTIPKIDINNINPGVIVHLDLDLYSSTYEALEFLYKNNLIVHQTYILFDDWYCMTSDSGVQRAFKDINIKYPYFKYGSHGAFDGKHFLGTQRGFVAYKK